MTCIGDNNRMIVLRLKLRSGFQQYLNQKLGTVPGSSEWSYFEGRCDSYTLAINLMDELYPEIKELMDNYDI